MATAAPPRRWPAYPPISTAASALRQLVEQHLVSLPHGLLRLIHVQELHTQLLKHDLHLDPHAASKLLSSYALLRCLPASRRVFASLPNPHASTFLANTLLRAYALNAMPHAALAAFSAMPQRDTFTYSFLIKVLSAASAAPVHAKHSHVVKIGSIEDTFVGNALIDAYSKNGGFLDARKVFDEMPRRDVVSWNSAMAAMVRQGEVAGARRMFDEMPEKDTESWNTMLDGYAKAGEVEEGF